MTYTAPTDDIIVQEGTFAFSYTASGTVYAGQALTACGTMQAKVASNAEDGFIGVAAYGATNGEPVAVYGPGNVVRMVCLGDPSAGDDLMVSGSEGKVGNTGLAAGTKIGVALEDENSTTKVLRVQLI